jgi:cation diffusion facilitator family transporter
LIRFVEGKKRSIIASITYSLLAVIKIVTGLSFYSIVLYADGIHTVADALTGMVVFLGLFFAERYPSEKFPFGLYKAENLASLIVAIAIAYAGIDIIMESISVHPKKVLFPIVLIGIELISALLTYWLSKYLSSTPGIKLDAIAAEGTHAFQDVLASLAVAVGIVGEWFNIPYLGEVIGIGIALYIIAQAYFIGKDAILTLLDAGDEKASREIKNIALSVSNVIGIHEIRVRKAGPFLFATMHLEAPPALSVKEADKLADIVEEKLRKNIPSLLFISIHVEPGSFSGKWKIALLEDSQEKLAENIDNVKKIKIIDTQNNNTEIIDGVNLSRGNIDKIARELKDKGVDAIIFAGKERLLAIKAYGIEIYYSPSKDEEKSLELFKKGLLND